jgi:hypothetical protein
MEEEFLDETSKQRFVLQFSQLSSCDGPLLADLRHRSRGKVEATGQLGRYLVATAAQSLPLDLFFFDARP